MTFRTDRERPAPGEHVQRPECGCETARVVVSHFNYRGCFCPECEHVWV